MSSDRQAEEGSAPQPAADGAPGATEAGTPQAETSAEGGPQRHTLRLGRNWRRRHRIVRPAPRLGEAEGAPPAAENGAAEPASEATAVETVPGNRDGMGPRRRRRRPRYPIPERPPGENGETAGGDAAAAQGGAETPTRPLGTRPPRTRNRRRRRPPAAASGTPAAGDNTGGTQATGAARSERPAHGRDRDQRARGPRADGGPGAGQRDRGRRDEGRRGDQRGDPRGKGRGGPPGRDRGGPGKKIERKLYSFDSVVDRGFEDVEEEAGTRRVHWTILKRTTADQISRKPVSAVYVVQRDGNDSEFPNLGAARSAVNKTIVHPEKLTRSKEEYAAEKSGKR
jgi:hypothetical protein